MGKNLTIILIGLLLVGCGVDYKFKKAQKLEKQGRNKEAISQYLNLIQKSPRSPRKVDALFNVAEIYFRLKEFEDAKSYFQNVVDKHPDTEYAEPSRQKLNEIEKIKNEVTELLKEGDLAYRDNKFKTAIEKYETAKTLNPRADVESKISQTKEKQCYVERVNEFNTILRKAKKFDWKMPPSDFFAIEGRLKKVTYGENEFERKRDEKRAERDYQEIIQSTYHATIKVSAGEYNFSKGTLSFKNLDRGYHMGYHGELGFNRDIKFKSLKLDEKEAEIIKRSTKSSYFHTGARKTFIKNAVDGTVLFKIMDTHERITPGWGGDTILHAEVIDARIKVPRYGYLYMSK